MKRFFCVFLFSFLVFSCFAGVLGRPRKMKVAQTQYFDVIFCDESLHTANLVIQNADLLYEQAYEIVKPDEKIRMPIIISPDSDKLKITYSPNPYNRIVIFEGVPTIETALFENTVLSLLFQEIAKAVQYSVSSKFVQVVKKFIPSDMFQPIPFINLPFSFAEGFSFVEGSSDGQGMLNDKFALQQLVLAKAQNKFPNWPQISVVKNSKKENDFSSLAGAAFIAFIQQRWGMEKFLEFWNECGKLHLYLTSGIFFKVYNVSISSAWNDFYDAIPLPEDLELMEELEKNSSKVIKNDTEGAIKNILSTPYGIIWYDDIRHEVDILDPSKDIKMRQLLFLASDVNRISVSPDGRFLVVSYTQIKNRDEFKSEVSWIYDIQERSFFKESYDLREGAIVQLKNGLYVIAGINVKDKAPSIEVYTIPSLYEKLEIDVDLSGFESIEEYNDLKPQLLYERTFDYDTIPSCPIFVENDLMFCVVHQNLQDYILAVELSSEKEKVFQLYDENSKSLKIRELHNFSDDTKTQKYSFSFIPNGKVGFTRLGIFQIDENNVPCQVHLQKNDIHGGVNYPVLYNDELFYSANKIEYNELKKIPFDLLDFSEGYVQQSNVELPYLASETWGYNNYKNYNPLKYWFHGLFIPMLPVKQISMTDGPKMWPGLGLTYITNTDPLLNTDMIFSAAFGFANIDFEYFTNPNSDTLQKMLDGMDDFSKNWAFSFFIENTSTPVDISLGSIFAFDPFEGTYNGELLLTTAWQIPLGMTFRKLNMDVQSKLGASTYYFDNNQIKEFPNLSNWPKLEESYKTFLLQSTVTYSNVHQYGVSSFEKRGLTFSTSLSAFWDLDKTMKFLEEKKQEKLEATDESTTQNSYSNEVMNSLSDFVYSVEQFTFGFSLGIAIPRLTPLSMYQGMVLSVPATLSLDVFKEIGTALKFSSEILLFGMEINQGVPILNLFFSRVGLKFGYTGSFLYDTQKTSLPNMFDVESFRRTFTESIYADYISFSLDLDFVPIIGRLTETMFNTHFDFHIYLHQQLFKFQFSIEFGY